jgi:hypothetical protein
MANLLNVHGRWVNLEKPGGQVFFVGGDAVAYRGIGASDNGPGTSPEQPLKTIAQAITNCTTGRGDTIVLLPGDLADITTALAMSKADVTLTGTDPNGWLNPSQITGGAAIDVITVTAANCVIEDLHFAASGAAVTSRINVAGAGLRVRDCTFECGANDVETITVADAGDDLAVENCRFYVTANGPDAAIEFEAAGVARTLVRNNIFDGGTDTNGWDVSAVNSDVANTGLFLMNNVNHEGEFSDLDAAATGVIAGNLMGGATLGGMLDPGSCFCFENYEADVINQSGRLFPSTVAS